MPMESGEWRIAAAAVVLALGCTLFLFDTPSHIAHLLMSGGTVSGGINITDTSAPSLWEGVFGNLSNGVNTRTVSVSGGNIQGRNVYSACPSVQSGEIYFAKSSSLSFSNIVAGNAAELDSLMGIPANSALSATSIFNDSTSFNVNGVAISAPSALLVSPSGQRVGLLRESVQGIPVFVTNIALDSSLYNGQMGDYQIMLPVYGSNSIFNISLDPANTCPTICGNSVCDSNETSSNCLIDCPIPSCGNGVCNETESCAVCAADCGFCFPDNFSTIAPPVIEQPIYPAVAPVGPIAVTPGTSARPEPKQQKYSGGFTAEMLYLDPPEISVKVQQGSMTYFQIRIMSTYSRTLVLNVDFSQEVDPFITTERNTLFLTPQSDQILPMTISASIEDAPGTYTGVVQLIHQNGAVMANLPVLVQILPSNAGFTYNLESVHQRVQQGQQAIIAYEILGVPEREVAYRVELFDVKTQKAVVGETFTKYISGAERGQIILDIPDEARVGRYIVTGTASYTDLQGNLVSTSDVTYVRVISLAYLYFLGVPLFGLILLALGMTLGSYLRKAIAHKQQQTAILMLEDQYQDDHPLLTRLDITDKLRNKVLIIEARKRLLRKLEAQTRLREHERESARRYLTSTIITMRDFAKRLNAQQYDVHYYKSHTIHEAVSTFIMKYNVQKLYVQEPKDGELLEIIKELSASHPQIEIQ